MRNSEIRAAAKQAGVFLYEVAERLQISEPTMTRLMRRELSDAVKLEIEKAIAQIAAEKTAPKN